MLEYIQNTDYIISTFIANIFPNTPFFDSIFSFLSLTGLTAVVWIVILLYKIIKEQRQHKEFIFYFILTFTTTFIVVNIFLKNVVKRDRPYVAQSLPTTICPKDYSFPSGHASSAFVGAVVFASFDKKRKNWYYTLAVLISLSRIYLLCHYFFDVMFGALIGYGIGKMYLIYLPYRKKI